MPHNQHAMYMKTFISAVAVSVLVVCAVAEASHGCSGLADINRYSNGREVKHLATANADANLGSLNQGESARRSKLLNRRRTSPLSLLQTESRAAAAAVPCGHIAKLVGKATKEKLTEKEEFSAVHADNNWWVFLALTTEKGDRCEIVHVTEGQPLPDMMYGQGRSEAVPPKTLAKVGDWHLVAHRETKCPVTSFTDEELTDVARIVEDCLDPNGEDDPDYCRMVRKKQASIMEQVATGVRKVDEEKAEMSLEHESNAQGLPKDTDLTPAQKAYLENPDNQKKHAESQNPELLNPHGGQPLSSTGRGRRQRGNDEETASAVSDSAAPGPRRTVFMEVDDHDTNPMHNGTYMLWTDAVVPYHVDTTSPGFDPFHHFPIIARAIQTWETHTCIAFDHLSSLTGDVVKFQSSSAGVCSSAVGRKNGTQELTLGHTAQGSCQYGNTLHEIGHALGMWHTHQRSNAGFFITIKTDNIEDGKAHNFLPTEMLGQGQHFADNPGNPFQFDYSSIMMYPLNAFSKNGQNTIDVNGDTSEAGNIGQRSYLTVVDMGIINSAYSCLVITLTDDTHQIFRMWYHKNQPIKHFKRKVSDALKIPPPEMVLVDNSTDATLTDLKTVSVVRITTKFDRLIGLRTRSMIPWLQKVCADVVTNGGDQPTESCYFLQVPINRMTTLDGLTDLITRQCMVGGFRLAGVSLGRDYPLLEGNLQMFLGVGTKIKLISSDPYISYPFSCFPVPFSQDPSQQAYQTTLDTLQNKLSQSTGQQN